MDNLKQKQEVYNQILKRTFPENHKEWGGSGLIITKDPHYKGYSTDLVICSNDANVYSWLLTELYRIYDSKIDYMNKYVFILEYGNMVQEQIKKGNDLTAVLEFLFNSIVLKWDNENDIIQ